MADPYARDKIENWVSDFLHGDRARRFKGPLVEYATEVLAEFLTAASAVRGIDPSQVEEADVREALLGRVAAMEIPPSAQGDVPELCGAFLEDLEGSGRVGGGRALGLFVRALREPFLKATGTNRKPERRVAPKLGPNELCPCGSGRKFKRCCKR